MATTHVHKAKTEKQLAWRKMFAEAATMCKEKVKDYPKGRKLSAFRECMRATLRGRGK